MSINANRILLTYLHALAVHSLFYQQESKEYRRKMSVISGKAERCAT